MAVASQLNVVGTQGATSSAGVMLSCFTSGVPSPTFVLWYFQNQLVGNLSTLATYPAAPPNQRLSSFVAGTYSCSVVTSAGTATANATVEVDSEEGGGGRSEGKGEEGRGRGLNKSEGRGRRESKV